MSTLVMEINHNGSVGFENMEIVNKTATTMNITETFHNGTKELEISSLSSAEATPSSTTHLPTTPQFTSSASPSLEYQYYVIGVYAFFAIIFTIGLVMILVSKLKKACCSSKMDDQIDHESAHGQSIYNPQDNLAFEHEINVGNLEVGRIYDDNSDYDNYSNPESETDRLADIPPAYEHPPSYSIIA